MPLPFHPQTPEELRARYPAAVARVFHREDMLNIVPGSAAGLCPECVFDWHDGLRLIVSMDDLELGLPVLLHVSASSAPGSQVQLLRLAELADMRKGLMAEFRALAEQRFLELSGRKCPPFLWYSDPDQLVAHWMGR